MLSVPVSDRESHLSCSCHEKPSHRSGEVSAGHCQVSAFAVVTGTEVIWIQVVLGFLKVPEDAVVAPTGVSQRLPVVVVFTVASDVQHVVDGAGST